MPSRDEWLQIGITAFTGGVVGALVTVFLRVGASLDNLLNFLGGAVGAGLAVIGALWLEARKEGSDERAVTEAIGIVAMATAFDANVDDRLKRVHLESLVAAIERYEGLLEKRDALGPMSLLILYPMNKIAERLRKAVEELVLTYPPGRPIPEREVTQILKFAASARETALNTMRQPPFARFGSNFAAELERRIAAGALSAQHSVTEK